METVLVATSVVEDSASDNAKIVNVHVEADISKMSFGRNGTANISNPSLISRMALNDNKAGMEGLDRDRINKIIHEASKGSKFYENEKKKEEILNMKIKEQQALVECITTSQLQLGLCQADHLMKELEDRRDLSHTIVHVDMDAFFAAVEMRDDPSLRNKPMAVGSMSMLSTSNYIARRFGIRAGMPGFIGRKLCPELVIIQPDFEKYVAASETVREILALYDCKFLPLSLDEAYLDLTEHLHKRLNSPASSRTFLVRINSTSNSSVCTCDLNLVLRQDILLENNTSHGHSYCAKTDSENSINLSKLPSHCNECHLIKICSICKKHFPSFTLKVYGMSAEEAVLEMRNRIEERTRLTASAGIAPNTMLAKVCSDRNKPNGQFQVIPTKQQVKLFISELPVRKIPGIGNVTEKLLQALGVITCHDLYEQRGLLYHVFSPKSFHHFMDIAMGIGSSTVERDSERKSMSTEQTFADIMHPKELLNKCQELCHILARDLKQERLLGKTVTLKIKTVNFEVKTRTLTLSHYSDDEKPIFQSARQLLETEIQMLQPGFLHLRLMGVKMSKLISQTDCSTSIASFCRSTSERRKEPVSGCGSTKKESVTNESRDVPVSFASASLCSMTITESIYPQNEHNQDCQFLYKKNIKSEAPKVTSSGKQMARNIKSEAPKVTSSGKQMARNIKSEAPKVTSSGKQMARNIKSEAPKVTSSGKQMARNIKSEAPKVTSSGKQMARNIKSEAPKVTSSGKQMARNIKSEAPKVTSSGKQMARNIKSEAPKVTSSGKQMARNIKSEAPKVTSSGKQMARNIKSEAPKVTSSGKQMARNIKLWPDKRSNNMSKYKQTILYNRDDCPLVEENGANQCGISKGSDMTNHALTIEDNFHHKASINTLSLLATYPSSSVNTMSFHFTEVSPVTTKGHQNILTPASKAEKLSSVGRRSNVSGDTPDSSMILCPVCGQQKYQWPLDQLNMHIDLCLSRSTVRDILLDQQNHQLHSSVSKKR